VERTTVSLLSREGRPGQVYGEIAVSSPHVALGYWRNPELTESVFRPDPAGGLARMYRTGDLGRLLPDGALEFVGRRDLQVKLNGFRVELGEVEAALALHPGVREAAAAVVIGRDGEKSLAGYFVSAGVPPSTEALRHFLRGKLPVHMIPSAFVQVPRMPLTPSGKVDRRSLPAPERSAPNPESTAARDPLEQELVELWKAVLKVDRLGIRDDFFDLGGHSVLALTLMMEIEKKIGVSLPLTTLLEAPTVETLAEVVRRAGAH
jgi:acyl-CoA synthetase (AMP-forming)/AMP-acid ligase II/acyl carrier protein